MFLFSISTPIRMYSDYEQYARDADVDGTSLVDDPYLITRLKVRLCLAHA